MVRSNGSQNSNKSIIAKDKLCDQDFDKLVLDTSQRVTRRDLDSAQKTGSQQSQQASSESSLTVSINETKPIINDYNRLNQPKRPMNAFMVWGQAIRRELHLKFSNVQNALLSKALGRVWKSLNAADKEPYVRKANLIKADHKRDYPNYRYQPRRIQERKSKSNMLIGIDLNHPVNNQQTSFITAATVTTDAATTHSNTNPQHFIDNQSDGSSAYGHNLMNNFSNQQQVEYQVKRGRNIDGAQTFEYQPYSNLMQSNVMTTTASDISATTVRQTRANSNCNNCNNFDSTAIVTKPGTNQLVNSTYSYAQLHQFPQQQFTYEPAFQASNNYIHSHQVPFDEQLMSQQSTISTNYYGIADNILPSTDNQPSKNQEIKSHHHQGIDMNHQLNAYSNNML